MSWPRDFGQLQSLLKAFSESPNLVRNQGGKKKKIYSFLKV